MTNAIPTRSLVSIGMPVYNEERDLAKAIDAVLAQDYEQFELIICDNASDDATPRICAEYASRDARIRYHRNESNIGGINNFNRAFELATGEFFMWAAGHDLRHPTHVSRCVEILRADPYVVLCYPQTMWIDEHGRELEVLHEHIDTRGLMDKTARLNVVLWGLHTAFPIYGLIRSEALRRTSVYTQVVSPDIALLCELSLLGTFAHITDSLLYAKMQADKGDWAVYVGKHFKGTSPVKAQRLYWRMIGDLYKRISTHTRSPAGRLFVMLLVLGCMLTKYRWMLTGLRSLKDRKRAAHETGHGPAAHAAKE